MCIKNTCKTFLCISFMIIMLLLGMVGCSKPQAGPLPYDNSADVLKTAVQKYNDDIEQLNLPYRVRMTMSVVYDMETLQSKGIVQTVRYNKGRYYSITPVQDNRYLLLLYSEDKGNPIYVVDGFLVSTLSDKHIAKDFKIGMNRDEVVQRDPSASLFENFSYHRFSNNAMIRIEYEIKNTNQYVVSEIEKLNHSDSVLNYLLDQDLKLINQS